MWLTTFGGARAVVQTILQAPTTEDVSNGWNRTLEETEKIKVKFAREIVIIEEGCYRDLGAEMAAETKRTNDIFLRNVEVYDGVF